MLRTSRRLRAGLWPAMLLVLLVPIAPVAGTQAASAHPGASASTLGPVGAEQSRKPARPANRALRVVTFNTEASVSPKKFYADMTRLRETYHPDIISLQEMGSPEKRQLMRQGMVDCGRCPYDVYMPLPATPASTPILYRSSRLQLVEQDSVQVTQPTFVGRRGAGPSTIRPKFVNRVALRDLASGRLINVLNNHAVPSVQGKNGGPNRAMAKRVKIYRQHMAGLVAMIDQIKATTGGQVLVTGDLNVNFRRDRVLQPVEFPYRNLGSVGLEASYDWLGMPRIGTHVLPNGNATRLIDYVYITRRAYTTPIEQHIMTGLHSDHRPLVVSLKIKPMARYAGDRSGGTH